MASIRAGGNLFLTLANALGEESYGMQARQERMNEDALRRMQLDMTAQSLQSQEADRLFRERETANLHTQQRSGVTALGQYINQNLSALHRPTINFTGNEDLSSMEVMSRDLGTLAAQNRAFQMQNQRDLTIAVREQQYANSMLQGLNKSWAAARTSAINELGKRGVLLMTMPKEQQEMAIRQQIATVNPMLYGQLTQAAQRVQQANQTFDNLNHYGSTIGMRSQTVDTSAYNSMPFEALPPDEQQRQIANIQALKQAGKPIDEDALVSRGFPIDHILGRVQPPAPAAAPAAPPPPFTGFGDPRMQAMFKDSTPPMSPNEVAGQLTGQPGWPAQPPAQMPGPSPVNPLPPSAALAAPHGSTSMFTGGVPAGAGRSWGDPSGGMPPAAGLGMMQNMLFSQPAPTPPTPPPGINPTGGISSMLSHGAPTLPNAAGFAPQSSTPQQLPAMNIQAQGNPSAGFNGTPLPTTYVNPGYDPQTEYTKLRGAMSAPEAEGIARGLLDHGESYDLVTAAIPQPYQGLVSAKLPKRISSITSY